MKHTHMESALKSNTSSPGCVTNHCNRRVTQMTVHTFWKKAAPRAPYITGFYLQKQTKEHMNNIKQAQT